MVDYQSLIMYWKNSRERTLRYIKEAPLQLMSYKPNDGSFSFIRQVLHIISWEKIMFSRLLDPLPLKDEITEAEIKTKQELIQMVVDTTKETEVKVQSFTSEMWKKDIFIDNHPVPFIDVFLELIEHEAHHRGQLVVYFRLTDHKPPDYIADNQEQALRVRPHVDTLLYGPIYG